MDGLGISTGRALAYSALITGSVVAWLLSRPPHVHVVGGRRSPPGPKRLPLLGNIRNFPKRWFVEFSAYQKEYGDILYFELPGMSVLVLHSLPDVEELLVKRAPNYSHRSNSYMVKVLMDFEWSVVQQDLGDSHNEMRKVFRKVIGPRTVSDFDPLIEGEAETLQGNLFSFSGDPEQTLMNAVGAAVIKLAYGERVYQQHGEELTRLNVESVDLVTWVRMQLWLVNVFPIARFLPSWLPGLQFPKVVTKGKNLLRKLRHWGFSLVKQDVEHGKADLSVISKYLHEPEFSEETLRDAVALMYMPATDTTSAALLSLFAMLLQHPEVQIKAQHELDSVVGKGRPPKMSDIPQLTYLNACWTENFRLNPPAAMGVPRRVAEADVWKGYVIPKGTMVMTNIGFMMTDERIWGPTAEQFQPERFLSPDASTLPDAASIPFGFGRRICPGRYMAERTGILFAATVLAAYTIVPPEGETSPAVTFGDAFVRKPVDFRCRFLPRK
ncbi:hypothetical protein M408DRAFT_151524 [Serendipita vermifera MAFF 305830]|uniref:Cytochrome P450 n=1 Tax=Serendipita vermifera MAFF 305830 TaxID=933852 RepID=A0A0C2XWI9_SERVB|nr:hypothetical protein M408DRAFT_151524 [Serendipita vermifera MAFF 305830]